VLLAVSGAAAPALPAGEPIGAGVLLFRGAAGNAVLVTGEAAAVVVDAPPSREEAEAMVAGLPEGVALRWLLRTGPKGVRREGEVLLASRGALIAGTSPALAGAGFPRLTARGMLVLHLGGDVRVELREFPGPAPGTAIAAVPGAGVVLGGACLPIKEVPVVTGDPAPWADAISRLMEEFPSGTFVAANGSPGRALDLRFLRDYLASLRRGVEYERAQGRRGEALVKALVERQRPRYGTWSGFAERAAGNVAKVEALVAREELARRTTPRRSPTAARSRQSSSR
jgi:hypothetical protein